MAGDQHVDHGLPRAAYRGGVAVGAVDFVPGVGQVGPIDELAGADLEAAEDVFLGDGLQAIGNAGIAIDKVPIAAGLGGALHVGIEGRGEGDGRVEELAKESVDL